MKSHFEFWYLALFGSSLFFTTDWKHGFVCFKSHMYVVCITKPELSILWSVIYIGYTPIAISWHNAIPNTNLLPLFGPLWRVHWGNSMYLPVYISKILLVYYFSSHEGSIWFHCISSLTFPFDSFFKLWFFIHTLQYPPPPSLAHWWLVIVLIPSIQVSSIYY